MFRFAFHIHVEKLSRNPCHKPIQHIFKSLSLIQLFLADVMQKLGAHTVLAVDVGAQDEQNFHNYGDNLSGSITINHLS